MDSTHNTQPAAETTSVSQSSKIVHAIRQEIGKVIVGQEKLIDRLLLALMCDGHMLLEGVPGLAKTTMISTLANVLAMDFKRIQLTPDLLPSDIIGSRVYHPETGTFSVKKGPVFTNFLLADEINRSPAKVQSALLEAMQERQVTIGDNTFPIAKPFFVMATQNPIEQEGTYPLPEAQTDRFLFKTVVTYPTFDEEVQIMDQLSTDSKKPRLTQVAGQKDIAHLQTETQAIFVDESIKKYIASIVRATREPATLIGKKYAAWFAFGASPRASIGLLKASKAQALLSGRTYVVPEDVKEIALDVLRHRIMPTYEAEAENVSSDDLVALVLEHVPVP